MIARILELTKEVLLQATCTISQSIVRSSKPYSDVSANSTLLGDSVSKTRSKYCHMYEFNASLVDLTFALSTMEGKPKAWRIGSIDGGKDGKGTDT
mmetsp:Transcript_26431/g.37114  ORF Transcript_26431/g.37114 Transcript_26431/m.37114 type:complete len:96 (+) Transcript_26431:2319-2606(+)